MTGEIESRVVEKTARGIADAASRAIRDGAYAEGEHLPTIRDLASALGVSPSTVAAAWTLLARAGVVHSDGRRGTTVSRRAQLGPERTRRTLVNATRFGLDLSTGLPDTELLPDLRPALGRLEANSRPRTYLDEPVIPGLLTYLAEDWPFPAEVITVLDGAHDALDLMIATKLRYGDRIAVERVTDANLLDLLEVAGVRLLPVDVDGEGLVPESLGRAIADGARWVFAQPRAQHPTGSAWSAKRASELATVVRGNSDVAVVEVDFSSDVASSPLVSIGTHVPTQVLHVRGYSASHGPELRMGAIGGPVRLMDDLIERRHLGQGWSSRILQTLLLDLLRDPTAVARVAAARDTYARRRARLLAELAARDVPGEGSDGFFVRIRVPNEAAVLVALASQGIGVAPGTPNAVDPRDSSHVVVTSALLPEDRAADVAEAIADAARPRRIRRVS